MSVLSPSLTLPEIGSMAVYETLLTIPAVVAATDGQIINRAVAADGEDYPFLLHHNEPGTESYGRALGFGRPPESWRSRYVIRLACEGPSVDPIIGAVYAIQQRFLAGPLIAPPGYFVSAELVDTWPQTNGAGSLEDGGIIYSIAGDYYRLEVLNQGA